MRYFYKHFDATEGIKTGGKFGGSFLQITESQLKEVIQIQNLAFIEVIKNYDNFDTHYLARINLTSPNNYPGGYVLTSNNHQVLYYESIDNLLATLNKSGYDHRQVDLNIVDVFSGF